MTTELTMLVLTALLSVSLPVVYLIGRLQTPGGIEWGLGNRERSFAVPEWVSRAERAHRNLTENIAPFAILVLVAVITGKTNTWTAAGATIFFLARLAHAATYTAGLTPLRTIMFFIGVFGELLILSQLFT